jgi:excisionase family DNA binding protein
MAHPMIIGDQVWCPRCGQYAMLLRTSKAARVADVSCKTVYRYIEEGKVHFVKIAGSTIRVCAGCLLRHENELSV